MQVDISREWPYPRRPYAKGLRALHVSCWPSAARDAWLLAAVVRGRRLEQGAQLFPSHYVVFIFQGTKTWIANSAVILLSVPHIRSHILSSQRIGLAITSATSLLANQLVASETEWSRDHGQSPAVIRPVNLSFSFRSHVSRHLIDFIAIGS